jgi:hypothetical protein
MNKKLSDEELGALLDLERGGVPLDRGVLEDLKAASRGLSAYQTGTVLENTIFDLDSGGSGYILSIAICNDSERPIRLHEFGLRMLWHEPAFRWLDDPSRESPRESGYSFARPGPVGFERGIVLNHCVGSQLNPGDPLEGLLLGTGQAPIPEEYRDRQRLQMGLSISGSQGHSCATQLNFYVSRPGRIRSIKHIRRDILQKIETKSH